MILHVECSSLQAAQRLYSCAYGLGFRNSGISISKSKFVVAIRSALKVDAPIAQSDGVWIVDDGPAAYLSHLIGIANAKFRQNLLKLGELEGKLAQL